MAERHGDALRAMVRARSGTMALLRFRVGHEHFALPLAAGEEALDAPVLLPLPEPMAQVRALLQHRGQLHAVVSPARALGLEPEGGDVILLVRGAGGLTALAVDDVEDTFVADLALAHPIPGVGEGDATFLGLVRHGQRLVALVDPDALAACRPDLLPAA